MRGGWPGRWVRRRPRSRMWAERAASRAKAEALAGPGLSNSAALDRRVGEGPPRQGSAAGGAVNHKSMSQAVFTLQETRAMKFLMMVKHAESDRSQPIPQALMDAMGEFVGEGFKSGI